MAALLLALGGPACAQAQTAPSTTDLRAVSPALGKYAETTLDDLWKRPGLSPRDRSIATLAVLIARGQTVEMPAHLDRALGNGVTPAEVSEMVTHLAFYAGWATATGAAPFVKAAFAARGIGADQLPAASPRLLPLDEESEAKRAATVGGNFGTVSPGLVGDTTDVLFKDLWLRPGLSPRDRSLVTVSSLIALGETAQLTGHLGRALDNGLTKDEASGLISHLAYYAGWPNAFSAVTVAKSVFEARPR